VHKTLAPLFVLLSPALALAAEDAGGSPKGELLSPIKQGLPAMIAAFIVFAVVFGVLATKAWPQVLKGLSEREKKIRDAIQDAEQARIQAKAALEQYQKNLAEARAQAQKDLEAARAQQTQILAEMKAKSEREMAMEKDKIMREIEAAKKIALSEIYAQSAGLATTIAGKVLRREVNPGDAERLTQEAIGELSSARN